MKFANYYDRMQHFMTLALANLSDAELEAAQNDSAHVYEPAFTEYCRMRWQYPAPGFCRTTELLRNADDAAAALMSDEVREQSRCYSRSRSRMIELAFIGVEFLPSVTITRTDGMGRKTVMREEYDPKHEQASCKAHDMLAACVLRDGDTFEVQFTAPESIYDICEDI